MPDWLQQLLGPGMAAIGVYAGIRADLAALKVQANHAASSARAAHQRIDDCIRANGCSAHRRATYTQEDGEQ